MSDERILKTLSRAIDMGAEESMLRVGDIQWLMSERDVYRDERDAQAAEIKALRLHVRVAHVHLDALGEVEITRAMVEDDALDRRLSVEPTERWTMIHGRSGDSLARLQFGSTFDPHPQLRARKWREAAVLDYANAIATEFGIAALDVLEALAEQARADRAEEDTDGH